jgi:hypothetical protein
MRCIHYPITENGRIYSFGSQRVSTSSEPGRSDIYNLDPTYQISETSRIMLISRDNSQYDTLSDIADTIFRRCDDDPSCIASEIRKLDPDTQCDLLTSDLLNAWQVFWYYFKDYPGDEAVEFLNFHPAGDLVRGVPMGDVGLFTLTFQMIVDEPEIIVSDDIGEIARFRGITAWEETRTYIEKTAP